MTWPDSVSGWCFGASFVALLAVIAATVSGPVVMQIADEAGVDILWRIVEFGFAALVGSFILGIICSRIENLRRKSARG